jgi:hypothetical protein
VFTSDAAGVPKTDLFNGNEGVGGICLDGDGIIISAYQVWWNANFIKFKDSKGAEMGSKTTTLEMIGILLHLVFYPHLFSNQHAVFKTDNMACFYGWDSQYVKNYVTASIIVKCIALLAAYLNCYVHFDHTPRLSNWESTVADRLSRKRTTLPNDKALVRSFGELSLPVSLKSWLSEPSEDWSLPVKIVKDLFE